MPFNREIYVNLPVKDLERSKAFFAALGFEFNERFTDDNCASIIIGEKSCVMLLPYSVFDGFIPGKTIANAEVTSEVLVAVSTPDREAVDAIIANAVAAGGSVYREAADHGWVYYRAFQDLDGHIWEVMAVDERLMPEEMKERGG
jgi:predicted lactoylglutathione lyase